MSKKIPFKIWPKRPDGTDGKPNAKQKLLWFEKMPRSDSKKCQCIACRKTLDIPPFRPHLHGTDVTCLLGGTRSGKTIAAVARCAYIAKRFPGAQIIVGSLNFTHLEETVMEDWRRIFTINSSWDHPWVKKYPTKQRKKLILRNKRGQPDSVIRFSNLEQVLKTAGLQADLIHIEEPQLLKGHGGSQALEFLITRLSSPIVPFKQVILTGNPIEELEWLYDWFHLEQYEDKFEEELEPIGKPCDCQICHKCRNDKVKKPPEYDETGTCPQCGYQKTTDCPGRQHYQRVILCSPADNFENLHENYAADLNSTLSHDAAQRFSAGKIIKKVSGLCYGVNFSRSNILKGEKQRELDTYKDIQWHLDWNNRPQCSGITQEYVLGNTTYLYTIDEIIEWDAGAEQVAKAFVDKYKHAGFKGRVMIWGDPAGFYGNAKRESLDNYHTLKKILEGNGFSVVIKTRRTKYPIKTRIESTNVVIKDGNGTIRWFVNERCRYHINSAEKTEWNKAGAKEEEKTDKKAREKGKPTDTHWTLTHPMAGFGYYVVAKWPSVPHQVSAGTPLIINPGSKSIIQMNDQGEIIERPSRIYKPPREGEEEEQEIDRLIEDNEEKEKKQKQPESLAGQLRGLGLWGSKGGSMFRGFGFRR